MATGSGGCGGSPRVYYGEGDGLQQRRHARRPEQRHGEHDGGDSGHPEAHGWLLEVATVVDWSYGWLLDGGEVSGRRIEQVQRGGHELIAGDQKLSWAWGWSGRRLRGWRCWCGQLWLEGVPFYSPSEVVPP